MRGSEKEREIERNEIDNERKKKGKRIISRRGEGQSREVQYDRQKESNGERFISRESVQVRK